MDKVSKEYQRLAESRDKAFDRYMAAIRERKSPATVRRLGTRLDVTEENVRRYMRRTSTVTDEDIRRYQAQQEAAA